MNVGFVVAVLILAPLVTAVQFFVGLGVTGMFFPSLPSITKIRGYKFFDYLMVYVIGLCQTIIIYVIGAFIRGRFL
jgi:hypothetical protein